MNLWAIQQSECAKVLDLKYFAGEKDDCIWKILIFDKYCQDILSTLFRVLFGYRHEDHSSCFVFD